MCVAARLASNPCPSHSCVLLDLQLGVLGRGDFALCFGVVVSSRRFCRRRFCWNCSSCLADDPTRRNWPACGGGYSPLYEGLTIADDLGHGLGGHLDLSLPWVTKHRGPRSQASRSRRRRLREWGRLVLVQACFSKRDGRGRRPSDPPWCCTGRSAPSVGTRRRGSAQETQCCGGSS